MSLVRWSATFDRGGEEQSVEMFADASMSEEVAGKMLMFAAGHFRNFEIHPPEPFEEEEQ